MKNLLRHPWMSQATEHALDFAGKSGPDFFRRFVKSKGIDRRYNLSTWFLWWHTPQGHEYWQEKSEELIAHLIRGD